jgi:hypothetical protein
MANNDRNAHQPSRRRFLMASLGGTVAATGLALSSGATAKPAESPSSDHEQPQQRWKVAGYMRMVPVTDDQ